MIRKLWPFKKREKTKEVITCSPAMYEVLCQTGYTPLSNNPDVRICVDKIAKLISSMTIHLMENTESGDRRIVDGLSRVLDIMPSKHLTRKDWVYLLVRTLLLDGEGNAVVYPRYTAEGYLEDMQLIAPSRVSFWPTSTGYAIRIDGKPHDPGELLHFKWQPNPDSPYWGAGIRVLLKDVLGTLRQASATTKDFLGRPHPSVVISAETDVIDVFGEEGRNKLYDQFVRTTGDMGAWMVPGSLIKVEQLKPQSLKDLAISDSVMLDRRFITALFGVPRFFLGTDQYNRGEFNHFITTTIRDIGQTIMQEMTSKLLLSPDRYLRFNPRSLYDYSITELANIGIRMRPVGVMTGNEVREWIGLDSAAAPGMDDFAMLENYIPAGEIGNQEKLKGGDKTSDGTE